MSSLKGVFIACNVLTFTLLPSAFSQEKITLQPGLVFESPADIKSIVRPTTVENQLDKQEMSHFYRFEVKSNGCLAIEVQESTSMINISVFTKSGSSLFSERVYSATKGSPSKFRVRVMPREHVFKVENSDWNKAPIYTITLTEATC